MNNNIYWIWLSNIDLFSHKNTNILLDYFKSPSEIWKLNSDDLNSLNLSEKYISRFLESKDKRRLEEQLTLMEKHKIKFISIENKEYPQNLKNIYDYPYGIYIKGNLSTKKHIAIVGSRKCTDYGVDIAKTLSSQLAQNNITVVSGMAKGIDSFAHIGAIETNINLATIAVLGCGLDICYPKENCELMNKIIQNGAVISEYPIGTNPNAAFFPQRNRIISGLSEAIIIVEASKKSGSLITADLALEQGKEVFAVPGNITSWLSEGTNDLIKQGANLITSIDDVLDNLGIEKNKYTKRQIQNINNEIFVAPNEKLVYDCISLEPQNIDAIFGKLDYPIDKLQSILTMLELKGYIKKIGGQYIRIL